MKSGGPWNLRGLRPEARAAARDAARRSGMSVGEWLNAVIRPAEEREADSRRSERSDRMESGREPGRHREPQERDYERERYSGRRESHRSESHGRSFPERQEFSERGFRDEDVNHSRDREHSNRPKPPRDRAPKGSPRDDARDDLRDREQSRPPHTSSREWDEQRFEASRTGERESPRDRHRGSPQRPEPSQRAARNEDWRESSPSVRPDRDSQRHRESPKSLKARNEHEGWHEEHWGHESRQDESREDGRNDKRERERSRVLSNREPDEDRFEPRNIPESDRYPEWDRSPPRIAPEREGARQGFSAEGTDRHFSKSSHRDAAERVDAERSNFDHERDRAPRSRASFETDEPFETISRGGSRSHERDSASGRYASERDYGLEAERADEDALSARRPQAAHHSGARQSADQWDEQFSSEADEFMPRRDVGAPSRTGDLEDLPLQRQRFSREEHRQRRDVSRQRPGSADDERWPPEHDTFGDENTGLGGPYRDLGAAARTPPPSYGREERDAAVEKAIAEITVRQRALEEAAAAEMTARLRRAEVRAAQQAESDGAAHALEPSADAPAPPRRAGPAAPAPQKVTDDLVAEITARMRALDSEASADRKAVQRPAERQSGAGKSASQRLFDDMAGDIPAKNNERGSGVGGGSFSLEPVSPDSPAERGSRAGADDGRKGSPALGAEIATIERQLRQLTGRIEGMRPGGGDLKTSIDGLRRELSEMGKSFTEALPRRALESLELEIKKLGYRLDDSRQSGGDQSALAVIEGGLAEVRDGLRGLAPAEELVGFGDAVASLTEKVDAIVARNDTGAIEQLRITMGDLRHAVSHVASDDSLNSVADEVRLLSGKIDALGDLAKDDSTALEQLHDAIGGLRHAVAGVASGDALGAVADEVRLLSGKIDGLGDFTQGETAALQQLNNAIGDLRQVVAGVASGEALSTVGEEVRLLSAKVDSLGDLAKGDPGAMEQLHIAISNLRHAVSRVASDDAVSRLGEEVRLLSAKMDDLSQNSANNRTLLTIESRIDALTTAIHAATKNGHAMPRELEKLLSALIDKLELSQLTQTDHTALAHLEDRITMLMQRLDASDARLGMLEGVERGLADLLVYVEQLRGGGAGAPSAAAKVVSPGTIDHQFAGFKDSERRTQDSIEAVQGTVDHVVDRLARLESDMRVNRTWGDADDPLGEALDLAPSLSPIGEHEAPADAGHVLENEPDFNRGSSTTRTPIDPDLPPDHPLEPGRTRRPMSPVERLAALDSAVPGKPPIIPDPPGGKADFIAAARRAAQAASSSSSEKSSTKAGDTTSSSSKKLSERLRTLFVAAAVVAIVVGGFRVVSQMLDHGSPSPQSPAETPRVLTEPSPGSPLPLTPSEPAKQPSAPGRSSDANTTSMPKTVMVPTSGVDAEQNPTAAQVTVPTVRQSLASPPGNFAINSGTLPDIADTKSASGVLSGPDVTGSLPPSAPGNSAPLSADKLPVAIGGPGLRAAALAGDPAASYEVGVRYAEGRNVPQNNEEAAHWLEAAAKKGFVPAQFRLGTLYEKGVGVKKDLPQALTLYRTAADKGHGKAMHNLAVLYAEGATGAPDYRSASQWFRKAADLGVTDSQFNLAILYARGVGVEQSFSESYKWFALAAKQGDKDAAQKRDEVASRLDPQTLAAAKSAADQWTAQAQPAEAVSVKASEAWDPPAKPTSALKPKSHSAEKMPAPDVMKVN